MRTRPAQLVPAALAALALLAVSSAPASAYGTRYADFDATISGTYVNEGTMTSTGCFAFDEEAGERVELPAQTGSHSERTTFRSTGSVRVQASKADGERNVVIGGLPIPVRATMERRSALATPVGVRGCTPQDAQFDTSCGTRTKPFKISIFGLKKRPAVSYGLSNGFTIGFPDDPFECPAPEGSHWWGGSYSRGNGDAALPVGKLFRNGVKRIVVRGEVSEAPRNAPAGEDWSASSKATLRWTLVLERRGRVRDLRS